MRIPIITLTTDFGHDSTYVAAMKGALLSVAPESKIVDLSHSIAPQDLQGAAWFLDEATPYFPAGTLHVVVVDPGVGTPRALVYVRAGPMQFLAPDNGVLALVSQRWPPSEIRELREPKWWRHPVSATFHGRDILAPVAGHLALGLSSSELGPERDQLVTLPWTLPTIGPERVTGQVIAVDAFGNLITNISEDHLSVEAASRQVVVGQQTISEWVRCYGDGRPGSLVCLFGSSGRLEVAVVNGNAAQQLGGRVGDPVTVEPRSPKKS